MKNLLIILTTVIFNLVSGQRDHGPVQEACSSYHKFPLRTFNSLPEEPCNYLKDKNNELPAFEGTWKGTWDNKIVFITFKKISKIFNSNLKYYSDYLIGKYKILDSNGNVLTESVKGNILFDTMNIADYKAKIKGGKFKKTNDKYSLTYVDSDLCYKSGFIEISFTDTSKTQLNWNLNLGSNMISSDCAYYNTDFPDVLPAQITLIKQ
ncbi:hypothetical protein CLU96_4829 [Chryseobacterium sp. 52]|uniref:DUF6705 family protein n=1 Tax=Chryseobacterium sp. 52 TaxID=2035213 RepID=UPI000C184B72|nr:DUF6705 family protein [Chryseobacterium sp. 52]PIF47760.1 hypothetical protein CLU96_4829 [Chryseobacterium sp. 52]